MAAVPSKRQRPGSVEPASLGAADHPVHSCRAAMTRPGIFIPSLAILLLLGCSDARSTFLDEQKKYVRVREAIEEKAPLVTRTLAENGLSASSLNILIVAYKDEGSLELYGKSRAEKTYRLIRTYKIVAKSGVLGPKSAQGDFQVPEGFYHIDRFNPVSNFYLSLGINYPNNADRRRIRSGKPGGDIFIHGSSVTVGCLPITDDKIKELYLYAAFARDNGQLIIPVYLFPFRMSDANMREFERRHAADSSLTAFWRNLKQGFDLFMATGTPLAVVPAPDGHYAYQR
ncbi:MAG: L,D-transpeptidase family protein [Azoarcus sp.]|nr:L,D-transpeptidase family protein [Azoarcus sp.]